MGVPKLHDLQRLRVMTWACAVMTVCEGRTDTVRKLFRKKGKITSTDFNRCLAEGRPWPDFEGIDEVDGAAIQIETRFPGTLIWLIHPIWNAVNLFPTYTLETTFLEILAMRPSVQNILIEGGGPTIEWSRRAFAVLDPLHDEGSLDALLALMLLSRQAYCLANVEGYCLITPEVAARVRSIECLEWMPPAVKQLFVSIIIRMICLEQPSGRGVDIAEERRRRILKIDISSFSGNPISELHKIVEIALEGAGTLQRTGVAFSLPKSALASMGRLSALYDFKWD